MTNANSPSHSLARELVEGFFTLFVGLFLQIGRCFGALVLKIKRASARALLRTKAIVLGRRMHELGVGNQLIRQQLTSMESNQSANSDKYDAVVIELGMTGLEPSAPLPGVEDEYHQGRNAYLNAMEIEGQHDRLVAKIWPTGPIGWTGLIGSYVLTIFAIGLVIAYLSPSSVPRFMAQIVGKAEQPKSEPTPAPKPDPLPKVKAGDITLAVKSAAIGVRQTEAGEGTKRIAGEGLKFRIVLTITNTGTIPIEYQSFRGRQKRFHDEAARMVDNRGVPVDPYLFLRNGKDVAPEEGGILHATIAPGESVDDLLVFGTPEPKFTSVDLYLPQGNLGLTGDPLKLTIPASSVPRPESFQ